MLSLCLLFILNQTVHQCQSIVSDHQMRLSFHPPPKPTESRILSPSLAPLPLVVVGSLSAHIKVNRLQQHTGSQHGEADLAFKWPVRGPESFLPAVRCDGNPSVADTRSELLLF